MAVVLPMALSFLAFLSIFGINPQGNAAFLIGGLVAFGVFAGLAAASALILGDGEGAAEL
jgi:hypothetical protein